MIELKNPKETTHQGLIYKVYFQNDLLESFLATRNGNNIRIEQSDWSDYSHFERLVLHFHKSEFAISDDPLDQIELSSNSYYHHFKKIGPLKQCVRISKMDNRFQIVYRANLEAGCISTWSYEYAPKLVFDEISKVKEIDSWNLHVIEQPTPEIVYGFSLHTDCNTEDPFGTLKKLNQILENFENRIYSRLEEFQWDEDYEKHEELFCTRVLKPLLTKIGFKDVRYVHGTDEFGRDFLFVERNLLGTDLRWGLQAKTGKIDGGVKSIVDTLISQIDDAFKVPFRKIGSSTDEFVQLFIIATSGSYSRNAKEKILAKIPELYRRYVFFLGPRRHP